MMKKFETLDDLQKAFPNEQSCIDYLEEILWKGKTPISPFDPNSKVIKCADQITKSKYPAKYTRYKCTNTRKYFNVKNGTIFENTKLPLKTWFIAHFVLSTDKRGIASIHLPNYISVTQKTAWFMEHRLRNSFDCSLFKVIFKGVVEADETYLGGKNKNRHWNKKIPHSHGRSGKGKIKVFGIVERESGILFTQATSKVRRSDLEPVIRTKVETGATVNTDEWRAYNHLYQWFNHQRVNHGAKQFVNGNASTNTIENRWTHLKRMYVTYRKIGENHAQRYLNEYTFRSNTRNYSNQERFDLVLLSSVGKRLTYQQLIS